MGLHVGERRRELGGLFGVAAVEFLELLFAKVVENFGGGLNAVFEEFAGDVLKVWLG